MEKERAPQTKGLVLRINQFQIRTPKPLDDFLDIPSQLIRQTYTALGATN